MNDTQIFICQQCGEKLSEYGQPARDLFIRLCHLYLIGKEPILFDETKDAKSLYTIIRFLEYKRFVITSDAPDVDPRLTKVKPSGYHIIGENHCFCPLNDKTH